MDRFHYDKKKSLEVFNCAIHSMDLKNIFSDKCLFVDFRKEEMLYIQPIYNLNDVMLKYFEFLLKVLK